MAEDPPPSLLRRFFTNWRVIAGAAGGGVIAAYQAAGATSVLIASLILGCVALFLIAELWLSRWIDKTGPYKNAVLLAGVLLIGTATIGVKAHIVSIVPKDGNPTVAPAPRPPDNQKPLDGEPKAAVEKAMPKGEPVSAALRRLHEEMSTYLLSRKAPQLPPFEESPDVIKEFKTRTIAYDIETVDLFMKRFSARLTKLRQSLRDQDLNDNDLDGHLVFLSNNDVGQLNGIADRVLFIAEHLDASENRVALNPRARHLSQLQRTRITRELGGTTDKALIGSATNCTECDVYALEFVDVFRAAGWNVISRISTLPIARYYGGLGVRVFSKLNGIPHLYAALRSAGINSEGSELTVAQTEVVPEAGGFGIHIFISPAHRWER